MSVNVTLNQFPFSPALVSTAVAFAGFSTVSFVFKDSISIIKLASALACPIVSLNTALRVPLVSILYGNFATPFSSVIAEPINASFM